MRWLLKTLAVALSLFVLPEFGFSADAPRIVEKDGRYALLVDGSPFLVLGAQINNSSSWSASMAQVWPALHAMHANTVEAPVYWEQLEPQRGSYDFSTVDMLVRQAREEHLHLVLLWFGTWKNGNMHYVPQWVKTDPQSYPRVINSFGQPIDVLSANSRNNLEADKRAFTAMMHHLAEIDSVEHTVIFVQVENESGIVGSVRDFSPEANRQFNDQVPDDLLKIVKKQRGTWSEVFGGSASETFQAYYQARYVNEIAEAGKREFKLPLYCNVWLSYPVAELPERQAPNPGIGYPSGGPVQDMLLLWKALAPSVDVIGPDIYSDDRGFYESVLNTYRRPDNALWIPETGRDDSYAPFLFTALGKGAIGFSPFGIDRTGWTYSGEDGPKAHTENYTLLSPMSREIAEWNFAGKLKTATESAGMPEQELDFGAWRASVRFGFPQRDGRRAPGTKNLTGRALVAQLGPDEFLVTGFDVSVAFHQPGRLPGIRMQILSAEEGSYENGTWKPIRLWNGDQTDRGLNFTQHTTTAVRIRLGTF
jgi:beta-galactosidase GanA